MGRFVRPEGLVAPLDLANVDPDLIIPKQFFKSIQRSEFGPNLFDEMRGYMDIGEPRKDCTLRSTQSELCAQSATLPEGLDSSDTQKFWLRQLAGTCALGAARLLVQSGDRRKLCRYLFQQLFQERHSADRLAGQ